MTAMTTDQLVDLAADCKIAGTPEQLTEFANAINNPATAEALYELFAQADEYPGTWMPWDELNTAQQAQWANVANGHRSTPPPSHQVTAAGMPNWGDRRTDSLSGWINELATLADHQKIKDGWLRSAMRTIVDGLMRYAMPDNKCAGRGVVPVGDAGLDATNFIGYLIDKHEGKTITEERLQEWLGDVLRDPQYNVGQVTCNHCNGSGDREYLVGGGPDAHDETGPCGECAGSGVVSSVPDPEPLTDEEIVDMSAMIWGAPLGATDVKVFGYGARAHEQLLKGGGRPVDPVNGGRFLDVPGAFGEDLPDCGEAGHADGACGNAECLPSARSTRGRHASNPPPDLFPTHRARLQAALDRIAPVIKKHGWSNELLDAIDAYKSAVAPDAMRALLAEWDATS